MCDDSYPDSFYEDLVKEHEIRTKYAFKESDVVDVTTIYTGHSFKGTIVEISPPDESVGIFGTAIEVQTLLGFLYMIVEECFIFESNTMYYNILTPDDLHQKAGTITKCLD